MTDYSNLIKELGLFGNWTDCMSTMKKASEAIKELQGDVQSLSNELSSMENQRDLAEDDNVRLELKVTKLKEENEKLRDFLKRSAVHACMPDNIDEPPIIDEIFST